MKYFSDCRTIHEAKARFRELAKTHHPDIGGDSKVMQEIINEYDRFVPSSKPHTNRFTRFKPDFKEQTDNWNKNFSGNQYEHDREKFNFSSIPLNHPLYVELRELRAKFNYTIDEENRELKLKLEETITSLRQVSKEHELLKENFKKYKKKMKEKNQKYYRPCL